MGKLLKLELKHLFKTKLAFLTIILAILIAIALSSLVKYMSSASEPDYYSNSKEMVLSEENMTKVYDDYKAVYDKYSGKIPEEIEKQFKPYGYIIYNIFPSLSVNKGQKDIDYYNYMGSSLLKKNITSFYDRWKDQAKEAITNKYKENTKAYNLAIKELEKVQIPFHMKEFSGHMATLDYLVVNIFVIMFLCALLDSKVFSSNYRNKTDVVYRTTVNGRKTLGIVKLLSIFIFSAIIYLINLITYTIINFVLFGIKGWDIQLQLLDRTGSTFFAPVTFKSVYIAMAIMGLFATIAFSAIIAFVSSKSEGSNSSFIISVLLMLLPLFIAGINSIPNFVHFLVDILPTNVYTLSTGIATGLNYISLSDSTAFSVPTITMLGSVCCLIFFTALAIFSYSKHQCKR